MKLADYSYDLDESLIANKPPEKRGNSRLLVLDRKTSTISDRHYCDVAEYFNPGDLLILNNTKVIKARLIAKKQNGAVRELIILEKHSFDDDWFRHKVLYHGKIREGDKLIVGKANIIAEKIESGGQAIVRSNTNLLDLAEECGKVPLPPYIHREATDNDENRYQTIWASEKGSVAAPTASLNMTDEIITTLLQKGVKIAYITLHVGLGTFLPIRVDNVEDHHMHSEYFTIPDETTDAINTAKSSGNKVVSVGTTVARTLEYANEQIIASRKDISGEADIFIYPGYRFKLVDCLLTNFHAPKSTVLMLAAAFSGWDKLLKAYNHAINKGYHFLSYGDSMLIL